MPNELFVGTDVLSNLGHSGDFSFAFRLVHAGAGGLDQEDHEDKSGSNDSTELVLAVHGNKSEESPEEKSEEDCGEDGVESPVGVAKGDSVHGNAGENFPAHGEASADADFEGEIRWGHNDVATESIADSGPAAKDKGEGSDNPEAEEHGVHGTASGHLAQEGLDFILGEAEGHVLGFASHKPDVGNLVNEDASHE